MSDENVKESAEQEQQEPKKVSLKDAIRNKLDKDKQQKLDDKNNPLMKSGNVVGKSQMTKKVNNQHRRTGGS